MQAHHKRLLYITQINIRYYLHKYYKAYEFIIRINLMSLDEQYEKDDMTN